MEIIRDTDLLSFSRRRKDLYLPQKAIRKIRLAIEEPPLKDFWEGFLEGVRSHLETPAPPLPKSESNSPEGVRNYHSVFHLVLNDLVNSSFAYLITGREQFANLAKKRIKTVLSWQTWVHPAHYPKTIDLVMATVCRYLALSCQWLGDSLHPDERKAVSDALYKRVFEQYITGMLDETGWWARECTTNWCAVVNGGIGLSLINFLDDNALLASILNEITERLSIYLRGFAPDGGWIEGIGYWGYGLTWYLYFAEAVNNATRGRVNPVTAPQIHKSGDFPLHCYLPPDRIVNFCDAFPSAPAGLAIPLLKLSHEFNDPSLRWMASKILSQTNSAESPYLFVWHILQGKSAPPKKTATAKVFRKIQWASMRTSWEDEAVILATKAGYANPWEHTHLDAGTFVLNAFGKPLIIDLGRGNYSAKYFSEERWTDTFANTKGHNTYLINGENQLPMKEHSGRITDFRIDGKYKYLRMDITNCYHESTVQSVVRHFVMLNSGACVILDEVNCPGDTLLETRYHYAGRGRNLSEDEFLIQNHSARAKVKFASDNHIEIEKRNHRKLKFPVNVAAISYIKPRRTYLSLSTRSKGQRICILTLFYPFRSSSRTPAPQVSAKVETRNRRILVQLRANDDFKTLLWHNKDGKNVLDSIS